VNVRDDMLPLYAREALGGLPHSRSTKARWDCAQQRPAWDCISCGKRRLEHVIQASVAHHALRDE
jgi:hypothetical protein